MRVFELNVSSDKPVLREVASLMEAENLVPGMSYMRCTCLTCKNLNEVIMIKVMLKSIDEFWVILQSVFDPDDPDDIFRHQNLAYVYQITGTNDLANLMSIARHMVNDQISKLAEKFK